MTNKHVSLPRRYAMLVTPMRCVACLFCHFADYAACSFSSVCRAMFTASRVPIDAFHAAFRLTLLLIVLIIRR